MNRLLDKDEAKEKDCYCCTDHILVSKGNNEGVHMGCKHDKCPYVDSFRVNKDNDIV